MGFSMHTVAERPDLWERGISSESVWPEYYLHGDVLNQWWRYLDEEIPDFQFVLYDKAEDVVVAEGLPSRPPIEAPPEGLADHEARYVSKLLDVYAEQEPADPIDGAALSSHPQFGEHFRRQRISFYSAEALRLYARDSVPEGTFEALQDDIHGGVVEVAEASHACGMDRLRAVLTLSTQLDLSSHALISVSRLDDRKGVCHQLANDDRLTWTDQTS